MEPRDLGDGLLLRCATAADAEPLSDFNGRTHADPEHNGMDHGIRVWTLDLIGRPHPTVRPADFLVIVESATGRIVSSLGLISQRWSYSGIPVPVGRVELVATDPAYRRRGLVRMQMDAIHALSASRGELVQAITGIEWYYRQFGYEYALQLAARRTLHRSAVPRPEDGEQDNVRLRPATPDDIPAIMELDQHDRARSLVSCEKTAAIWRYEITGRSDGSGERHLLRMIETADGESCGYLAYAAARSHGQLAVGALALAPGISWPAAMPPILRDLDAMAAAMERDDTRVNQIAFVLGTDHPLYDTLAGTLSAPSIPYAWYIRIPDICAFLRHVAPVLERRLAASPAAGYTGELKLNFYRSGISVTLERGRIADVTEWPHPVDVEADAGFPDLTFLHLLFGHRSLLHLRTMFPDCSVRNDTARLLLEILFPLAPSHVWPDA